MLATTVPAASDPGETLAERLCSRCHAIGNAGESTHPDAPPFRMLHRNYPVNNLQEALIEGIITGHPDMPEFKFEPEDADQLINYMISIQAR